LGIKTLINIGFLSEDLPLGDNKKGGYKGFIRFFGGKIHENFHI
jgi:hypothetical protein